MIGRVAGGMNGAQRVCAAVDNVAVTQWAVRGNACPAIVIRRQRVAEHLRAGRRLQTSRRRMIEMGVGAEYPSEPFPDERVLPEVGIDHGTGIDQRELVAADDVGIGAGTGHRARIGRGDTRDVIVYRVTTPGTTFSIVLCLRRRRFLVTGSPGNSRRPSFAMRGSSAGTSRGLRISAISASGDAKGANNSSVCRVGARTSIRPADAPPAHPRGRPSGERWSRRCHAPSCASAPRDEKARVVAARRAKRRDPVAEIGEPIGCQLQALGAACNEVLFARVERIAIGGKCSIAVDSSRPRFAARIARQVARPRRSADGGDRVGEPPRRA